MTISEFLSNDHARLDRLLEQILEQELLIAGSAVSSPIYLEFKTGMLLHIRMEETKLLPLTREANNGNPIPMAAKLRIDHGAIAALLVPPPNLKILNALQKVLVEHNRMEEKSDGAYEICDEILGPNKVADIIRELNEMPPVPLAKNLNTDLGLQSAVRALERAGFSGSLIL